MKPIYLSLLLLSALVGCKYKAEVKPLFTVGSVMLDSLTNITPLKGGIWHFVFADSVGIIVSIDAKGKMEVTDSARAINALVKMVRFQQEHPLVIIFEEGDTVHYSIGDTLRGSYHHQKANYL